MYCNGRIVHPPGSSLRKRLAWLLAPPLGVQDPPRPVHPPSCGQFAPVCGSQGSPGGNHWSSCNWNVKKLQWRDTSQRQTNFNNQSYWKFPTIVSQNHGKNLLVNRHENCSHFWVQAAVVVPISVVLMPQLGTSCVSFFHHQLKMHETTFDFGTIIPFLAFLTA